MLRYSAVLLVTLLSVLLKAQDTNGLVARYTFNKANVEDDVGGHHGKAYNVMWARDRFGNANSACYLQGNSDSYLNLGTSSDLKPRKASISLWVTIDQAVYKGSGISNNNIICAKAHAGTDFNEGYVMAYHFYIRKLHCNTSLSETQQIYLYPPNTAYLRQWYHLVMTYDDDWLTFYIDGEMQGRAAKNFVSTFLEGGPVLVGLEWNVRNQRYLQGTVDDIRIYNRVISQEEVLALYNEPDPNRWAVVWHGIFYAALAAVFFLLARYIIRWRVRKALAVEKEKNQLKNNWYEQENRVLTAQMDPHFIFNSLNTIQQFILINDNENAQLYLSKFSRLLRMILENNTKDAITLSEEIDIIKKYLEVESLRFNNVFRYNIALDNKLVPEKINIPRFLIQPFAENAIWHGLLPKEGDKQLQITFEAVTETMLRCVIEDNGVGRTNKTDQVKTEENRSFAIHFIKQRLQLMSKLHHEHYTVSIIDKTNPLGTKEGTKVIVTLPILNSNA